MGKVQVIIASKGSQVSIVQLSRFDADMDICTYGAGVWPRSADSCQQLTKNSAWYYQKLPTNKGHNVIPGSLVPDTAARCESSFQKLAEKLYAVRPLWWPVRIGKIV